MKDSLPFRTVVRPAQLAGRRFVSRRVDRALGVTTTDEDIAARFGLDIAQYRRTWRAIGWLGAFRLVRWLHLGPADTVLDVGCGAGRFVCAAGRRNIRRVIGIELDPAFRGLAGENATRFRGRRCPVSVELADATTWEIPPDVTVVFFFNSFRDQPFATFLERLITSVEQHPRPLRFVYGNPVEAARVDATGVFRHTGRLRFGWRPGEAWDRTQRVELYEYVGGEGVDRARRVPASQVRSGAREATGAPMLPGARP